MTSTFPDSSQTHPAHAHSSLLHMQGKKQKGEEVEEEAQGHQRCDLPCRLMWQLCFSAEQWRGRVHRRNQEPLI